VTAPPERRPTRSGRRRPGLAVRLLAAQLLVAGAALVATAAVAAAVGPSLFRRHLGHVAHTSSPEQATAHAEQAFRTANLLAFGVALVAALLAAAAVSAFVTRRISRPVAALATAAADVADGRYHVTIPPASLGSEFDTLTRSFTAMAARLDGVETTRRRLLADLAHEMRTPVATLAGYLEALEDGVATADAPTLATLREQTRRLTRLAADIAAVSRAEEHQLALHPVPTAPAALLEAAARAAADRYVDRDVALTVTAEPDLSPVSVDADRLGQVLGNLLDNALRHTPPGGRVSLRAAHGRPAGHPPGQPAAATVLLEVTDTGDGVPAEHLPHLFERFYRVDAARDRGHGGSGIGLAIARALVEAHDGRLTAMSRGPGAGATFTVELAAAAPG
jgi:two-component system sensor histidine kinase BaeS